MTRPIAFQPMLALALGAVCVAGLGGCGTSHAKPPPAPAPAAPPKTARPTAPKAAPQPVPAAWVLTPPKAALAPAPLTAPAAAVTEPLFAHYCAACHGAEGRGDGQYYSDSLPARPANLTDAAVMKSLTDEQISTVITGGSAAAGKSPLCPPWGRVLSKEQIVELTHYVRGLSASPAK